MTALARPDDSPRDLTSQQALADPFLEMISRAADRPEVLNTLISVRNAELQRRAEVAYRADFAQMQPKLPTIDRKGRIEIREKNAKTGARDGDVQQSSAYAYWADILAACKPAMLEHGFGISFKTRNADDGRIIVTAILSHRDGHVEETEMIPLQHDSTGSKNPTQAVGSTLSYGQRYAGIMALGIASKEHDDNKGGEVSVFISDDQVKELEDLISSTGANKQRFLAYIKEETLDQMPIVKFDRAKQALLAKQKEAAQ